MITNSLSVRIEDFSVFAFGSSGTDAPQGSAIGVGVRNCAELAIERCGIFASGGSGRFSAADILGNAGPVRAAPPAGAGAPVDKAAAAAGPFSGEPRSGDVEAYAKFARSSVAALGSAAIVLTGVVTAATICGNLLVADAGILSASPIARAFAGAGFAAAAAAQSFLVLAGLTVKDNFMICPAFGVMLGDAVLQQSNCIYLLENAIDENTVLAGFTGIFVEGLTNSGAAVSIRRNDIETNYCGIVTGLDAAMIADNNVTQADVAQLARGAPATIGVGILVLGIPGYQLPLFEVRLESNRVAAIAGPGIVLAAPAVAISVTGNAIRGTIGAGITVSQGAIIGDLLVRNNEALIVAGPAGGGVPWVAGIWAGLALSAVVRDNAIEGIANAEGQTDYSAGIFLSNIGTGSVRGNAIADLGLTADPESRAFGIAAMQVQDGLTVSGNVIRRQTEAVGGASFFIAIAALTAEGRPNIPVSVQDNDVEGASWLPLIVLTGPGADCIVAGNSCRLLGSTAIGFAAFASRLSPVVEVDSQTALACNNRVQGPKGRPGILVSASTVDAAGHPAATIVGNIASDSIYLAGSATRASQCWTRSATKAILPPVPLNASKRATRPARRSDCVPVAFNRISLTPSENSLGSCPSCSLRSSQPIQPSQIATIEAGGNCLSAQRAM